MTEQINQESNDSVETPRTAEDVFTEMLDTEESNDKPEVENEEVATEAVEETDEETLEEEVEEESEEEKPETPKPPPIPENIKHPIYELISKVTKEVEFLESITTPK